MEGPLSTPSMGLTHGPEPPTGQKLLISQGRTQGSTAAAAQRSFPGRAAPVSGPRPSLGSAEVWAAVGSLVQQRPSRIWRLAGCRRVDAGQ